MENDTRYSVIPKHDTHTLFHLLVHRLFTHTLGNLVENLGRRCAGVQPLFDDLDVVP